jgi:ZIP family zinc transporter
LQLGIIGFLVGVVPVTLGMFWFPFLQTMSRKWLHAVLAFSAGILGFLVFDAGFEAFEVAEQVPSYYAGPLLVVLGIAGALLIVQAIMDWRTGDGDDSGLALAYSAALGIGLHNFAEGLAIGGAFALGRASLGAFLIVGFMAHNITEGPVFVAPLADGERPSLWHFGALGLIAGAPAILGGWIGIMTQSPLLIALFLAIGVGALLQVIFDIGDMIHGDGSIRSAPNLVGFGIGLVVMYATDLLIVL